MSKIKNRNRLIYIQPAVIIFIWVLLLSVPVLFGNFPEGRNWGHIFKIWKEYALLFLLFLVNRFLLLPFLFFRGKRTTYFIVAGISILILFSVMFFNHKSARDEQRRSQQLEEFMRPPRHPHQRPPAPVRQEPFIPPFANIFMLSILILGFDTGLNISIKWIQSEQKRISLEKENTESKLAFLQNQVSPHFFMNTLNNIHALVDIDTEEAKESIIKLSRLMAYLLYESQVDKIGIQKEVQFIKSYVELMKLRFSEKVKINLQVPAELPNVEIPPLLFISFIENAFKHGISYEAESFVDVKFNFEKDRLDFEISNSNHGKPDVEKNSGIGLENIRKRLELLFANNYKLLIKEGEDIFSVKVNIPV